MPARMHHKFSSVTRNLRLNFKALMLELVKTLGTLRLVGDRLFNFINGEKL